MSGHNLTMKFPPDFHNYTGLNGLVDSFSKFAIASPNRLILSCKPDLQKRKTTSYEIWLLGVLQKSFPKKFTKKYLCHGLFLILLKSFRKSGLQLYWRDTPALVFQNQPFVDLLQNRCSWIIHKIHGKTLMLELLF